MAETRVPAPVGPAASRRPRRPRWVLVAAVAVGLRVLREVGDLAVRGRGLLAVLAVPVLFVVAAVGWRLVQHQATKRRGGEEVTADDVRRLLAGSGLPGPAFAEDGTLPGASVFAVAQRSKVIELQTRFDVFGSDGSLLARVTQIGQSRGKLVARLFTGLDQFFTHHFDVTDPQGQVLLRLTRPRKFLYTKLHVFDGWDRFLGSIEQENVWGRIRFVLKDPHGAVVGRLRAEKLHAWDFQVVDVHERPVATVVKAWEGWARTILSRADRYAVRIEVPVTGPLRALTVAAALAVDLGLKQDARGFG